MNSDLDWQWSLDHHFWRVAWKPEESLTWILLQAAVPPLWTSVAWADVPPFSPFAPSLQHYIIEI